MSISIGVTIQILTLSAATAVASPGAAQDAAGMAPNGWLNAQELGG